ncbi:hypothetical protein [Candidatus Poriferisodalis sp.]|uniref:hypothetical protein n=1 Tax=Candidatus Poriferisodalis sp. TaxID=3101277 RepID=UPI003B023A4D
MSAASLLVVLADDVNSLRNPLREWSSAGLLSGLVLCDRTALAGGPGAVECEGNLTGGWSRNSFLEALHQRQVKQLNVASLRPALANTAQASAETSSEEEHALELIRMRFNNAPVDLRAFTVSILDTASTAGYETFSPAWDMHLIHDRVAIADSRLPAHFTDADLDAEQRMALCAMTAVTLASGWSFSRPGRIPTDPGDATLKWVRVARPQLRVAFGGQLRSEASIGQLPTSPPWPMPEGSGAARAQAGAVPPPQTAEDMASALGLTCAAFDPEPQPRTSFAYLRQAAWLALTKDVDPPPEVTDQERELQRLREMLARRSPELGSDPVERAVAIARLFERSGLSGLVGGAPADPVRWEELRDFAFCLVDGGEPDEQVAKRVPVPVDHSGTRLVWTHPASIIPAPQTCDEGAVPPSADATTYAFTAADMAERTPQGDYDNDGDSAVEALAEDESLFGRIGAKLHSAMDEAVCYCKDDVRETEQEHDAYEHAERSVTRLRRIRNGMAVLVLLAIAVVAERMTGLVGTLLDAVGWGTIGGLTTTPLVDAVIGVVVSAAFLGVLTAQAFGSGRALLRHYDRQRLRQWRAAAGDHYATETARLCAAVVEFDDHARIIGTMLHRPYAIGPPEALHRVDVGSMPSVVPMVLAQATPDPSRLAELRMHERAATVKPGWIAAIFDATYQQWHAEFADRVGGRFETPDDDHTMPGSTRHRDMHSGEELPGAREHFATAIADGDGPRLAATKQISDGHSTNTADVKEWLRKLRNPVDLFGEVHVPRSPALNQASTRDFLHLRDQGDTLTWDLLTPAAQPPSRDIWGTQQPAIVAESEERPETLLASWRLLISEPFEPKDLSCWQPGTEVSHTADSVSSHPDDIV